jgi:putative hydroxymethylpyrimidine transport system substrate-binding protein
MGDVNEVNVQQGLLPAVISGRADAMLGGFSNVEGVDLRLRGENPRVVPVDRLGIPTYDELVLVASDDELANDPQPIRLFIAALERGTRAAAANPAQATGAVLDAGNGLDPKFTAAEVRETLPLLAQRGTGKSFGWMDPAQWRAFAHFFADNRVIDALPAPNDVLTNDLLPGNGP